jgi:hypothetical protein
LHQCFPVWLGATTLALEAQWVIALRMMMMAGGGAAAAAEAQRMVTEKMLAAAQAQFAAGLALATGRGLDGAARAAARPYRRAVSANRRRLTRRHQRSLKRIRWD